jgi:hypothetical protein
MFVPNIVRPAVLTRYSLKQENPMAIYHLNLSHGSRSGGQSAGAKLDYISREGKYAEQPDVCRLVESSNLPSWANNAREFWRAADQNERANARLFSQLEFALPAELTPEGQLQLVREFAADRLPKQPYTFAIHEGKGTNPHVHLIYSERALDGIERTAETFFKQANKKAPERGGAAKNRDLKSKEWLCKTREKWADDANKALRNEASIWRKIQKTIPQIDHRTLEAQGIEREPQIHRGPERQGRIIRQYEEVIHVGKEDSRRRERKKMVNEQPRSLNKSEVERRAHQDIERNKRLKESNPRLGDREQEAFERSVNNELRMEEASWEIEWSSGRSSELLEASLQQFGQSLEQRERIHTDHERKLKSDGRALRERLQSKLEASQRHANDSLQTVPRRTERPRPAHQFALRDFELPARKIKPSYERERRENPRMGQRTERVNRTIQQRLERLGRKAKRGFRQISEAVKRRTSIAAKSLERYTTVFTALAEKTAHKLPKLRKIKQKNMPERLEWLKTQYIFGERQTIRSERRYRMHTHPPGYTCLFRREKKQELRKEMAQERSKFANVRIQPRKIDRGNDNGISMGR